MNFKAQFFEVAGYRLKKINNFSRKSFLFENLVVNDKSSIDGAFQKVVVSQRIVIVLYTRPGGSYGGRTNNGGGFRPRRYCNSEL